MKHTPAFLHFADGTKFNCKVNFDASDKRLTQGIWGEAAFTTSMTGYQETITDPSYLGQQIIFAYPHIGNYPAQDDVNQSEKCHATSLIAQNFSKNSFLDSLDIPLVSEIDTRRLVKYITSHTNHISVITSRSENISSQEFNENKLFCNDLNRVSCQNAKTLIDGKNPILVIDYGIKQAIIDNLLALNLPLVIVNHQTSFTVIKEFNPRLIFLSNGPGNPEKYVNEIKVVKEILIAGIPVRGICLGHQILSIALGSKTIRLPFGQRGSNHPVLNHVDGRVYVTGQNHGYATDTSSFRDIALKNISKRELIIEYTSLFDDSIEGISSKDHFIKTVQFHPEVNPGPHDTINFFREIGQFLAVQNNWQLLPLEAQYPIIDIKNGKYKKSTPYKRIMVIGSGPIKIGQASEFDYSGTQACRVLKEEGIEVILLNSNPATIMTDKELATRTYIEPITKETIKIILVREKVDAIISTMGGQTALNICIELEEDGFLEKEHITLLGANGDTIRRSEDRKIFAQELSILGYKTGVRRQAETVEAAKKTASFDIGYPLLIRRDFALGGQGAALIYNEDDLNDIFTTDLKFPLTLERSLHGFKEIELEVMVDKEQNGVVICSIENIDPCGVHTGDSITVAPAQTISDRCMQNLRTMSLNIAKKMGVVAGGANVQFAINPMDEDDITVIEMNPRVSRSSALASKATGYPIAKISTKLAIGYTLKEILNDITLASPVCFEPSLDYVAIKIPIFPFSKFPVSSKTLGPQMRSVGEVLAIGSNFPQTFLKALRSLELGLEIPKLNQLKDMPVDMDSAFIIDRLKSYNDFSLLTILEALRLGIGKEDINNFSKISSWFIDQMDDIYQMEQKLTQLPADEFLRNKAQFTFYKMHGFSDKYLARLTNFPEKEILKYRRENSIFPVYKAVDTCSGEFSAKTPYFYSTYLEENESTPFSEKSIAILGSGPNRIGQGIEFDYSCVKSSESVRMKGYKSILINSNPETVSTDYDSSDRLYLAPLYAEDVLDIFHHEQCFGIITSFSGQTGIKIRQDLERSFRKEFCPHKFLGAGIDILELTEDRKLFDNILNQVEICRTTSRTVKGYHNLVNAMIEIGFPVIIRPSYVIGGESMYIFHSHDDMEQLPPRIKIQLQKSNTSFLVENYLENAMEYDVDLIRDEFGNCALAICEHIEHAGVHSGDSGMITPAVCLTDNILNKLIATAKELSHKLKIVGPVNFQFAIKGRKIYCIEANPRGSRTIPFLSKAYATSLPHIAVCAMLGEKIDNWHPKKSPYFCVKQSTFPFDRFLQDDIMLGPKMRSTGETMGVDCDKHSAILKSYLGNYPNLSFSGKILFSLSDDSKLVILPYLKLLENLDYRFFATPGTCDFIRQQGVACTKVSKLDEDNLALIQLIKDQSMRMVFNTPSDSVHSKSDGEFIRNCSIQNGVPCFTRLENIKAVIEAILGVAGSSLSPLTIQELSDS